MPTKKTSNHKKLLFEQSLFWDTASKQDQANAFKFSHNYIQFLNLCRTEKETISECLGQAKDKGFKPVDLGQNLDIKNKKIFFNNKGKSAVLISFGNGYLNKGAKFLLAHVDSPRLDLKVKPLYEDSGIAYFKPHYYGGIKKYHWPTIPLSLIGTISLSGGRELKINIGSNPNDPVFLISDLLPHIDSERMDKPLKKAIDAEELNVIVGSIPLKDKKIKDRVKAAVLDWLYENYKIKEIDLFTADLRFVPSFPARDIGFDQSMIGAYGHDDKVCVYTGLKSFLDSNNRNTKILYLIDKEEIGSVGTTGAESLFLENVLDYVIKQTKSDLSIYDFYRLSKAISADVTAAFDPDYKQSYDKNNAPMLGGGVVVEKHLVYKGKAMAVDTDPAFLRQIIDNFDKNKVVWQTGHLGKVDLGGGGTVAVYLANRNLETVDIGVPLLNMHAPYELASKADIYSTYKGYHAFFEN